MRHSTSILLLSFFSYIWSVKPIKTMLTYSTIPMQNIKESLLGIFCAFSYHHKAFNAVKIFLNIDKVRFWLISGQYIVGLQNTQCIPIFFWEHFIFLICWLKGFKKPSVGGSWGVREGPSGSWTK